MNWLITGGCGFIGTSLIARLLSDNPGTNIRVLDNLTVGTPEDLDEVCNFKELSVDKLEKCSGVQLVKGDIRDVEDCKKSTAGANCIVHLAANTGVGPSVENPRGDMEANAIGTFNMLESARINNAKQFIFASSGAPAGIVEPPIHEEMAPHPVSPYGASKLAGEGYCSAYYQTFGINTIALRFGNVYGPRSKHKSSVVAKFIRQALNGELCEIYGDGGQTRDFIYIDDLVDAIIRSGKLDKGGEAFQIASNKETTLNELVEALSAAFKRNGIAVPEVVHSQNRLGDVQRNYSDTTKAREVLGWVPEISLKSGLDMTIKWFIR